VLAELAGLSIHHRAGVSKLLVCRDCYVLQAASNMPNMLRIQSSLSESHLAGSLTSHLAGIRR